MLSMVIGERNLIVRLRADISKYRINHIRCQACAIHDKNNTR